MIGDGSVTTSNISFLEKFVCIVRPFYVYVIKRFIGCFCLFVNLLSFGFLFVAVGRRRKY